MSKQVGAYQMNITVPEGRVSMISASPIKSPNIRKRSVVEPNRSFVSAKKPLETEKEKSKGFLEYVSNMYSKLLRIQAKNEENDIGAKNNNKSKGNRFYNKTALSVDDPKSLVKLSDAGANNGQLLNKSVKNTLKQRTEECRRTLGVYSVNNISIGACFQMYIEDINSKKERNYITFNDFCNLDFNGGFPEIIYDVLY